MRHQTSTSFVLLSFSARPRSTSLLSLSLLVLLSAFIVATPAHGDGGAWPEAPSTVTTLTDVNFDAHVFPPSASPSHPSRAWFIFFYAPWCAHCKNIIPQFFQVGEHLESSGVPHAKLGVVNAVRYESLARRFDVHEYPTLAYTTGVPGEWHTYHGGYDANSFAQFAAYLQRAVDAGSFADVLSDPRYFAEAETRMAQNRVPFYVYIPPRGGASPLDKASSSRWNTAVASAASLGNVRFGVLFGDDVPADWASTGGASYVAVLEAATRCAPGSGPGGAVLLAHSDAHRRPLCFRGRWLDERGRLSAHMSDFVTRNGFRAVEEASPGLFSVASGRDHHYLGLYITSGPLAQSDTDVMPVLRELARELFDAETKQEAADASTGNSHSKEERGDGVHRRITLAHADGRAHAVWRTRYHIEEAELPAFLVVDPRRDKVYRIRTHSPRFEECKSGLPWAIGGEQHRLLDAFLTDVELGRATGEKMTILGSAAELLLHLPGMEFVYRTLGYEDVLLVVMVCAFGFFSFILFLAICVEPIMERREAAAAKRRKMD